IYQYSASWLALMVYRGGGKNKKNFLHSNNICDLDIQVCYKYYIYVNYPFLHNSPCNTFF
ncbi:MAG: hypothetical protein WAU25_11070, partial [Nitrososphaeraceae archaeon]